MRLEETESTMDCGKDVEGAGVYLRHKDDGKLFRRYARNSEVTQLNECQLADEAPLLATTTEGAERALKGGK